MRTKLVAGVGDEGLLFLPCLLGWDERSPGMGWDRTAGLLSAGDRGTDLLCEKVDRSQDMAPDPLPEFPGLLDGDDAWCDEWKRHRGDVGPGAILDHRRHDALPECPSVPDQPIQAGPP